MENQFTKGKWVKLLNGDSGYIIEQRVNGCNVHIPGKHRVYPASVQSKFYNFTHMKIDEEVSEATRKAFVDWALDERRFDLLEG